MDAAYCTTIGADVSDRTTKICVMSKADGKPKIVQETTVPTTPDGFRAFLERQDKAAALVFETGTHCRWIDKVASGLGFKTFVANPCRLRMITESTTKNDKNDARTLARMALADIELLHPVKLRGDEHQKMVNLHEIRDQLVKERTAEVLQIRAIAKSMGFRLPDCSAECFHNVAKRDLPKELSDIVWPLMKELKSKAVTIKTVEKQMRRLAKSDTFRVQVERLMEIPNVGFITATCFVAVTGGDMDRFDRPRDIGPWLGVTPKQDQSGDIDRQCHITKAGSKMLRWKLTECAQRVLQKNSADMDLKVKGLRIRARGGKIAKGKSITAVARGLAVLMVAMLKKPDVPYVPLSKDKAKELAQIRAAMAAA